MTECTEMRHTFSGNAQVVLQIKVCGDVGFNGFAVKRLQHYLPAKQEIKNVQFFAYHKVVTMAFECRLRLYFYPDIKIARRRATLPCLAQTLDLYYLIVGNTRRDLDLHGALA